MKTILQLKFALILALVLPQVANSQFTNPERDTKWNIGLNMGGVWQDGDIKLDRPGFGYGFTIGKGIYEDPGKFWSLDARFRYMKGFTYGQELTRLDSADIIDNTIYSSNPSNYKNALGYTYLNNKTMIHDFSLEAVLNFHKLRERTGVLLSVFGGLGVTDYKTRTNLLDSNNFNKIYDYSTLDPNNVSKTELRGLQDDHYETRALYNDEDARTVRFMPSLGIGLGYQITPKWSFGFEHKVTFALHDEFEGLKRDGTEFLKWGNNDKYHYTSFFLRLNIFRGDNSTTTRGDNCPPPYLQIADIPNNYVVNEQLLSIKARVTKINSNNDVILVSNDQIIQTAYNSNTDYVSGNISLVEGENKILFIATNACGESLDSVIVIYNPEFCPKAVINITEPTDVVGAKQAKLVAKVLQLQGGTLQVKLNNNIVTHQYNPSTRVLSADLDLNVGANTVSIRAINKCGDTTVFKNIEYKCIAPTVIITTPENGKKYESQTALANYSAKTTNVTELSQIQVLLNGVVTTPTFNKSNGVISGRYTMREGSNSLTMTVTNDCGTQTKAVTFVYEKPCLLPVVTISAPRNNQNITTSSVTITGAVTNITNNSNVQLKVNGVLVNSNFNNGSLSTVVNLRMGANTIQLTGTNVCGTDSESINITYNCPKPVVTISSPANGTSLSSGNATITGTVTNISANSQMNLTVNGTSVPFTYSTSTRRFSASANFGTGQNVIAVSANTTCGTDSKTSVVNVSAPCPAPIVTIATPQNGSNLSSSVVTLTGTAINVSNQSQMRVTLNGVTQSFSFNSGSRTFSSSLNLRTGSNTILVSATTTCGTNSKTVTVSHNAPCPSPVVTIVSPSNGTSVSNSAMTLRGTAININNQSEMRVTLNGVNQAFNYNTTTKLFTSSLNLRSGNNSIVVSGTTNCGTDSKTVNLNYSQSCPAPVVTIASPRNGLNSTSTSVSFVGNVQNVTSSSQITLNLNGVAVNKSFNSVTKIVSATLNLKQGGNTIELSATNSCGTDTKTISVSFKCPLPTVNIASPNTGMRYTTNPISFSGFVSGISAKSQINITLNGAQIPFTYTTATSKFEGNMTMAEGVNTLVATVTNQCGTSSKSTTVTFTKPCPKPTVVITSPSNGVSLSSSSVTITGVANHLTSQGDLKVRVNGVVTPFTYNTSTKTFSANATLIEGNNTILATVATNCGNDSKTVNVAYSKPCPKPTVTIINPTNGFKPVNQYININGVTTNITSKSQMTLTLNGLAIPFTFNASTNSFTTTYDLSEGSNVITATVTNSCGTQSKTVTIGYSKPCPKPVLIVTSPTNGSTNTSGLATISGTATNITTANQISITVNGSKAIHTFNASTKQFTTKKDVKNGSNVIVVTLTNSCGSVSKTLSINYVPPCPRPTVSIVRPGNGTSVTGNKVTINGVASNLVTQSDMQVRVNGVSQAFNYNSGSGAYSANLTLRAGNNTVSVDAATNCGNDSKTIAVNAVLIKPIIRVSNPLIDTSTTSATQIKLMGTVERINSQSQFSIKINGANVTAYTFSNISSQKFSFNGLINLRTGNNVITITAIHADGGVEVINKVLNVTTQFKSSNPKGSGEIEKPSSGGTSPIRGGSRP